MREEITSNRGSEIMNGELIESLEKIHHFLDFFTPEDIESASWELIQIAFGSIDADGWSHLERSSRLFFHRQLIELAPALKVVDQRIRPLFVTE